MIAKITLDKEVLTISFNNKLPPKIKFQIEYFNLKKSVDDNEYYSSNITNFKIENLISFLEKNNIDYSLDLKSQEYLKKILSDKEEFIENTKLISDVKVNPKKNNVEDFISKINFLNRDLKYHQKNSLLHLYTAKSAANFSVPGSGKTTVILTYFEKLKRENKVDAILVVGPKNSFGSWETEYFENFNKKPKLKILGPNPKDRILFYEKILTDEIILVHFTTVTNDIEYLKKFLNRNRILLVIDEAHYIKKIEGIWSNSVLELSTFSNYKVVLTGTPIPNDLKDIYNYLDFLYGQNKILSSKDKSKIEILLDKDKRDEAIIYLRDKIFPYFIRITKNDLNLSKQKFNRPISIEMNPVEKKIYDAIVTKIKDYGREAFFKNADLIEQICKARIIRLKQTASYVKNLNTVLDENVLSESNEDLISDDISQLIAKYDQLEKPAKLNLLIDMVLKLKKNNKKVLIWSTHLKTVELIHKELSFNGINIEKIIGETDLDERKNIKIDFNDYTSNLDAIIATPQSCSESISLHKACQNAIYYDLNYNAAEFLQSLDRIHRVGGSEDKVVEYDFLQYSNTVDEKIFNRVFKKADRQMQIIEEDNLTFDLNDQDENWENLYNDLDL